MTLEELFDMKPEKPDENIRKLSVEKWDSVAKPIDGLGYFEETVSRIAAIQGKETPDISRKALIIMCADNGIVKEGVSQCGQEVTYEVSSLMGKRMSSVGIMTEGYPLDMMVYDVGINSPDTPGGVRDRKIVRGTADFLEGPAMSSRECLDALQVGIDAVKECSERGYGIAATGEMGIGNTTTSTAFLCAVTGIGPENCTGKGSGLTDEALKKKTEVIKDGIRLHTAGKKAALPKEVFEALRCLGGLDIAALAGVYIGGALYGIPVVIDGLISAAAALAAEKLVPGCRDYMIASHMGREGGMSYIMQELSLKPVIYGNMALGEGTGAVMMLPLLDMAMNLYTKGTSFENASIEQYERYS